MRNLCNVLYEIPHSADSAFRIPNGYLCAMAHTHDDAASTPPEAFRLEELETFKTFENQSLNEVNYYFWFSPAAPDQRLLLYLELLFASGDALILTSGEDSEAIRVTDAVSLIQHARTLSEQANTPVVSRVSAGASALWQPAVDQPLQAIRLSKNDDGLYHNDALLLDFGAVGGVLVALNGRGGLTLGQHQ